MRIIENIGGINMDYEYVDKIMSGINVDDKLNYSTIKIMLKAVYESSMEKR